MNVSCGHEKECFGGGKRVYITQAMSRNSTASYFYAYVSSRPN
jgi:hypothetical protein